MTKGLEDCGGASRGIRGSARSWGHVSRLVLRRSYLSGGQGVRARSSGKTKRLRSVVALPKG